MNKMHGKGKLLHTNNEIYEGDFVDDKARRDHPNADQNLPQELVSGSQSFDVIPHAHCENGNASQKKTEDLDGLGK